MDEDVKARDPGRQSVITRQPCEPSHGRWREDWPDPLSELWGAARDELELFLGRVSGHRWDGWRRLTGDAGYCATCSCGWRSTETGDVSPMLRQVKEHMDAVCAVRGSRPSTGMAGAPDLDVRKRDAGRHELRPDERTRELYASVEIQQARLSQVLKHSGDLLSASQDQAKRFVGVLEHAAARVAPEWARTEESVRSEDALQLRAEHMRELRDRIVAAATAVTVLAEEVALAGQDLESHCLSGPAGHRCPSGGPASGHGGRESAADDLRLACGMG